MTRPRAPALRLRSAPPPVCDRVVVLQVGNLIIYSPRREDSGNYSCSPSNLDSASVMLHVLSGQYPGLESDKIISF